ncbi:hypothetical protein CHS0354_030081 [Potamilus streckersoni]|uniref:Tryptophan synthase beta chain-like PALP domain-containing protein n=1 Tax=Potamilus streckersoni TaxID=2493646 RepID=A0AAE0RLN8_9BIVA|nr:hypothetical protein CHS0354_030081 [Potamilus streckersoni]
MAYIRDRLNSPPVTIGGAYSNSVLAVAAVAHRRGLSSVGFIRGDELAGKPLNPILQKARDIYGMELHFINRALYRDHDARRKLMQDKAHAINGCVISEGVSDFEGYLGVKSVFGKLHAEDYDLICVSCGTGTTLAGILAATASSGVRVIGFPAHILDCLIRDGVNNPAEYFKRVSFEERYTFGGFGKSSPELEKLMGDFYRETGIGLDFRYSGKLVYGFHDLVKRGTVTDPARVLVIHTGGMLYRPL